MQLQPHPWRVRKGSSYPVMLVGILGWSLRQAMLQVEGYNPPTPPSGWIEHIFTIFQPPEKKNLKENWKYFGHDFSTINNMCPKSGNYMVYHGVCRHRSWWNHLDPWYRWDAPRMPLFRSPTRILTYLVRDVRNHYWIKGLYLPRLHHGRRNIST